MQLCNPVRSEFPPNIPVKVRCFSNYEEGNLMNHNYLNHNYSRHLAARSGMVLILGLGLLLAVPAVTAQTFTVTPSAITFKQVTVGTIGLAYTVTVKNMGTTGNVVINSYSISPSEFQFFYGWSPVILTPNTLINYSIRFAPDAAQTFNGNFIINIQGAAPVVSPLTGPGVATGAKANISVSSLSFMDTPAGSISPSQPLTITNIGTTGTTVNTITVDPPFQVTGFPHSQVLQPGKSLTVNVNVDGTIPATYNNTLTVGFSNLLSKGAALSGNVIGATALGVTIYPTLPFAVVTSAYQSILTAAGGTPPYTWALASGSTLPTGLMLSSAGVIGGTLDSSVLKGTYSFTLNVTDSASNHPSPPLTLPVAAQTGARCNNIVSYIPNTTSPLIAINDLGTGSYQGSMAGLYPNGSNFRPSSFDSAGVAIAQSIQPLDANGNPDPVNGKIGLMSVGMSALFDTWLTFTTDFYADKTINPKVVLVPGAQPRAYASNFANPNDAFWNPIFQNFLPQSGITAAQVQVVYIKDIDPTPSGTFPTDMAKLQSEYESIVQKIHTNFPKVKLAYFGGSVYTGYSNGLSNIDSEPWAYESAFAVKWAIQDQINGKTALNWDSTKGVVKAPWMSWGAYPWANGLLARTDGLTWPCPHLHHVAFHPSDLYGREKETNLMINFFKSDATTTPWFLAH